MNRSFKSHAMPQKNLKIALQASRQERKGESLSPKKSFEKTTDKKLQNIDRNEVLYAENTSGNIFDGT